LHRVEIEGGVEPGFDSVLEAFKHNFDELGEIGAAVAVYHRGRLVVDVAAGRDPNGDRPFTRDSLIVVASCTKAAATTCVLMLAETGAIALDAPVARYWPEFAQAGKGEIPVRWVLGHQAGLPYPDPESGLSGFDQLAGPALVHQLEQQAPWWPPGTAFAYHPITFGTMLGELVARVTGQTLGRWFADRIAGPLGLKFWIGLPAALDDEVVPPVWATGRDPGAEELANPDAAAPGSYAARRRAAIRRLPPMGPDPRDPASRRAYYGTEVPGAYGVATARSLARMAAALIGALDGVRLLSPEMLAAATRPQTDGLPALVESGTAGPDIRFGLGYQLASPSMPGLGPASFGHTGAGGRLVLADPAHDVAFGYVSNSARDIGPGGDPRWAALLTAVRACI
jgi:CubicO group peptidase (beta-lactamase class C family)